MYSRDTGRGNSREGGVREVGHGQQRALVSRERGAERGHAHGPRRIRAAAELREQRGEVGVAVREAVREVDLGRIRLVRGEGRRVST